MPIFSYNMVLKIRIIVVICSVLLLNSAIPEKTIFNDPSYLESYLIYLKGGVSYKKNKFNEAINYYRKAVKIFNQYPEPYYKLAEIYFSKRDFNTAEEYLILSDRYKKSFRNKSDLAGFYQINGKFYEHEEKYEKALDNYNNYNSIITNNILICHKIGFLSYKIKLFDKALIFLEDFISNDKQNRKTRKMYKDEISKSYMMIINIYMDRKEYRKSLEYLKELYFYFPEEDIKERIRVLSNNIKYYK